MKSNHCLFPKEYIKKHLKDAPGRYQIVLQVKHSSRADLVAMGHRYNSKVTLLFAMSKNARCTRNDSPYEMTFADTHGNVHISLVERLSAMSDFFQDSNAVDKQNRVRQYKLRLEKK